MRGARLLPAAMLAMSALLGLKILALADAPRDARREEARPAALALVAPAAARDAPAAGQAPPAAAATTAPAPEAAERAILEALRARRAEIEARAAALAERELLLAAAERRIGTRLDELTALQARLEAEARARDERAEQGWRQMVRLYETMRPRDAAAILDELELPVLLPVLDRMREARAAPILAAMRPERARLVTAELARHRGRERSPTE